MMKPTTIKPFCFQVWDKLEKRYCNELHFAISNDGRLLNIHSRDRKDAWHYDWMNEDRFEIHKIQSPAGTLFQSKKG